MIEKGIFYDFEQLITTDTFKYFTGTDLKREYQFEEESENKADRLLCDAQQFLIDYIKKPMYENNGFDELIASESDLREIDLDSVSDKEKQEIEAKLRQINYFKRAIIHQAQYMFLNGKKYLSDGYDRKTGITTDFNGLLLAPRAEHSLRMAGFLNIRRGPSNRKFIPR